MAALLASGHALATVIISETLAQKVTSSQTVVLAEVTGVEGRAPFSNGHRPTVDLRVLKAWRGAQAGEAVKVTDWSDSPAFAYYKDGPPASRQQVDAARRQWQAAVITPPQRGERVLLMLGQQDGMPSFAGASYPDHIVRPDERTLELVSGFLTFSAELAPSDDLKVAKGQKIDSSLQVRNLSASPATFTLASIRLSTSGPQGMTIDGAAPAASASASPIQVPAQGQVVVDLDWGALFPHTFDVPGDYWLTIEIPAQGGERLQRHLEVIERSPAYACGRADQIARLRVASLSEHSIVADDAVYLRLRGQRLAPRFARGPDFAGAGAGQRWIVCAEAGQVTLAVPDTDEVRQQLGELLANDPLEWWSHAEDSDPRFAAPANQADGPASVMHQNELQRRLQELP